MSSPTANKVLYAYIAVTLHAVSLVLIREDNGLQRPVYYISKSLHEAEVRYSPLEKAILFPSPHGGCSNSIALEIRTLDYGLH